MNAVVPATLGLVLNQTRAAIKQFVSTIQVVGYAHQIDVGDTVVCREIKISDPLDGEWIAINDDGVIRFGVASIRVEINEEWVDPDDVTQAEAGSTLKRKLFVDDKAYSPHLVRGVIVAVVKPVSQMQMEGA